MDNLPTSPNEAPFNIPEWEIRQALDTLTHYDLVDLHWEREHFHDDGEIHGKWHCAIEIPGSTFSCEHEDLHNVLWFVYKAGQHGLSEYPEKREKLRREAYAKLTSEERKALGV